MPGMESEALLLLRELIEASGQVSKSIARRSALNHSELETLELLLKGPVGPTEIARSCRRRTICADCASRRSSQPFSMGSAEDSVRS